MMQKVSVTFDSHVNLSQKYFLNNVIIPLVHVKFKPDIDICSSQFHVFNKGTKTILRHFINPQCFLVSGDLIYLTDVLSFSH